MDDVTQTPGFLHLYRMAEGADWLHMCIRHLETGRYLAEVAGLDDLIVAAMVAEDTRSRVRVNGNGLMVLLKAMHLKGEEMARPEAMVSMRVWLDDRRVITTREADVDPIIELAGSIDRGGGPANPGEFLASLIDVHMTEVSEQVEMLEDNVDMIESLLVQHQTEAACPNMADTQTRISGFLRHLGPQRPVLQTLSTLEIPIFSSRDRGRLEDSLNQLLRLLETLQNLRDRIDILNDQVTRIQDRRLNRSSYAFAVVATIFLPLNFVTGLFGANLKGLPLADSPGGFWVLVGICAGMVAILAAIFRWRRWL